MDGDKVVHLSLREFTDALLPVPQELVSFQFPLHGMAGITKAFADMIENYKDRAWDNDWYLYPEDQLAADFTQIVNEHVLQYATGGDATDTPAEQGASYVMQPFPYKWGPHDTEDAVRLLDDEPKDVSHDANHEHEGELAAGGLPVGGDGRRWSTAALFRREYQPELDSDHPNWAYQSAFVQFTAEGAHNDPCDFGELAARADDEEIMDNRERIRRQMQSCADSIALYQHRTGVFSLVVGSREFRVVWWHPSGVVVSERVEYVRDARALVEVLLALVVADHEGVGYDVAATRLLEGSEDYALMDRVVDERNWCGFVLSWAEGTSIPLPLTVPSIQTHAGFVSDAAPPANAENSVAATDRVQKDGNFVFQYVIDYFRRSLAREYGFLRCKLAIGSDEFLVAAPLYYYPTHPWSPRGYVAFHKQSGRFVFLKDYWRPGGTATSEGDALRRLNEDGVGNVPTLVCHGVVGSQGHWMDSEDRRTKSEDIPKDTGEELRARGVKRTRGDQGKDAAPQASHYMHYRIVLKEVCLPLTAVTSSRQLVSVVGDCTEAHYDATEKSKLIHRNISSESIVVLPTFSEDEDGGDHTPRVVWRGVLADWEFARAVPVGRHDASESAPRAQRTPAAWRHMSVASLTGGGSHVTTTADELESFFHVVLHHAIRFCPHNVNATDFINTTFVPGLATEPSDGAQAGAFLCPLNKEIIVAELGVLKLRGRKVVFYRDSQSGVQSAGNRNAPLNHLLSTFLRWLKARYDVLEYESTATAPSSPAEGLKLNRDTVTHLPAKRLRDEPRPSNWNDAASITTSTSGGPSASSSASEERDPARPSDRTYELARRVDDHEAVRELFEEVLKSKDWPVNDVVEDQWIK